MIEALDSVPDMVKIVSTMWLWSVSLVFVIGYKKSRLWWFVFGFSTFSALMWIVELL